MTLTVRAEVYQRGRRIMVRNFSFPDQQPGDLIFRLNQIIASLEWYVRAEAIQHDGQVWMRAFALD
jgi:hypothetical protein